MNNLTARALAGFTLLAATALTACSSDAKIGVPPLATSTSPLQTLDGGPADGSADTLPPTFDPGSGSTGPTSPVRFVILTEPGATPVDLFDGAKPSGSKLASGLKAGTVTDYLADGPDGITIANADRSTVTLVRVDN